MNLQKEIINTIIFWLACIVAFALIVFVLGGCTNQEIEEALDRANSASAQVENNAKQNEEAAGEIEDTSDDPTVDTLAAGIKKRAGQNVELASGLQGDIKVAGKKSKDMQKQIDEANSPWKHAVMWLNIICLAGVGVCAALYFWKDLKLCLWLAVGCCITLVATAIYTNFINWIAGGVMVLLVIAVAVAVYFLAVKNLHFRNVIGQIEGSKKTYPDIKIALKNNEVPSNTKLAVMKERMKL